MLSAGHRLGLFTVLVKSPVDHSVRTVVVARPSRVSSVSRPGYLYIRTVCVMLNRLNISSHFPACAPRRMGVAWDPSEAATPPPGRLGALSHRLGREIRLSEAVMTGTLCGRRTPVLSGRMVQQTTCCPATERRLGERPQTIGNAARRGQA